MRIEERVSGKTHEIEIVPVIPLDYQEISKSRFWFNWNEEILNEVYKLRIKETKDILGLISLEIIQRESRIEIRLLAVSRENRGENKKFDHIAGNLIAFACIRATTLFGEWACVSLTPKTLLINHYMKKYKMLQAGRSLFVDGLELIELIKRYDHG
jgi:hypothetical protein